MQQTASRSGESDMTASDAESWAKLRLVEGESSAKKWELVSSLGHTTLTVGSNSDCTWVVRADGVRPIHFSLHWDGSTLRAADVYSAGDVRVDGTTLGSQWRALTGDVRIEFGKAAMQVETSQPLSGRSAEHPLEQPVASSGSDRVADSRRRSSSPSRTGKETLIGVAPSSLAGLQASLAASDASSTPGNTAANSAGTPASTEAEARAARAKAERSMKATLVGGIGIINAQLPLKSDPSPVVTPSPGATAPAKAKANATLMGFASLDMLRGGVGTQPAVNVGGQGAAGQPLGGGSLADADQRTSQGFPNSSGSSAPPSSSSAPAPAGRRMTKQGMVSQPPGVHDDAVAQAPVRAVSERPGAREPNERIGSAWQERADPDAYPGSRGDEARNSAKAGRTLRGIQDDDEGSPDPRAPRLGGHGHWDQGVDRMSDIPTQMRDAASFESRRPRRGFPWRYVGVLVLTSVAYFAWLYLLDHM